MSSQTNLHSLSVDKLQGANVIGFEVNQTDARRKQVDEIVLHTTEKTRPSLKQEQNAVEWTRQAINPFFIIGETAKNTVKSTTLEQQSGTAFCTIQQSQTEMATQKLDKIETKIDTDIKDIQSGKFSDILTGANGAMMGLMALTALAALIPGVSAAVMAIVGGIEAALMTTLDNAVTKAQTNAQTKDNGDMTEQGMFAQEVNNQVSSQTQQLQMKFETMVSHPEQVQQSALEQAVQAYSAWTQALAGWRG